MQQNAVIDTCLKLDYLYLLLPLILNLVGQELGGIAVGVLIVVAGDAVHGGSVAAAAEGGPLTEGVRVHPRSNEFGVAVAAGAAPPVTGKVGVVKVGSIGPRPRLRKGVGNTTQPHGGTGTDDIGMLFEECDDVFVFVGIFNRHQVPSTVIRQSFVVDGQFL